MNSNTNTQLRKLGAATCRAVGPPQAQGVPSSSSPISPDKNQTRLVFTGYQAAFCKPPAICFLSPTRQSYFQNQSLRTEFKTRIWCCLQWEYTGRCQMRSCFLQSRSWTWQHKKLLLVTNQQRAHVHHWGGDPSGDQMALVVTFDKPLLSVSADHITFICLFSSSQDKSLCTNTSC